MRHIHPQRWLLPALLLLALPGWAFDSKHYIDKSVELIGDSEYSLARTYLEPAVIDHKLSNGERSRAYYLRGYSYFAQHLYVSAGKDYLRALQFNPGNPGALAALGDLYFRGLGVEQKQELAFELFQKAASAGHPGAMFQLGYAYLQGAGVERNLDLARQWLEQGADQGNPVAMGYIARSYRTPYTDTPEPEKALEWYEKAQAAGSSDALVAMGYMYQNGETGQPDPAQAAQLYQQAADAGSSHAQVALAHLYLTGSGVAEDAPRAAELFSLAAEQGNPAAFLGLGHLFEAGISVPQDLDAALGWYEKAAEAEVTPAQMRLVYLLLADDDVAGALQWLARAAASDTVAAHNDYAWLLATTADAELRDGELALLHAQKAVAQQPSPTHLDTLAAAFAELGRFDEAIATQQQAIAGVDENDEQMLTELESHLAAYQTGNPWRDQ
jgi:TPR repeat protein